MAIPRDLQSPRSERAALVGLFTGPNGRLDRERSMDELAGLARAAGASVALRVMQERTRPDPSTFIGAGKLEALASLCSNAGADLVIVDHELSASQLQHMEELVGRRIVDRTQLILDIFAQRAYTREGKLQVELAQLKYLLPRLVGHGVSLSRLGGGIGTRGPGETQLETDRRRIRARIHTLTREIAATRKRRARSRDRRQQTSTPTAVLVGYTNSGKSTLFNLLTRERAGVSDALFVTLDPLVRRVEMPDRRTLLLSDTVGFIDRLPHTLIAAFRATLEEIAEADLLLHVSDASSAERERQMAAVGRVLEEVGASAVPALTVFNKCDRLSAEERRALQTRDASALCMSALTGDGRSELLETMASRLALDTVRVALDFDAGDESTRERIARLYRHSRVLSHLAVDGRISIEADVPRRLVATLARIGQSVEKRTRGEVYRGS